MTIIGITGGAGFIGGLMVKTLAALGYQVRVVDDKSGPIDAENPEYPALKENFFSPMALESFHGCDLVIHLAAKSGVVACASDPAGTRKVNVEGTRRLVEWCRETGTPLLFASSFSVVGVPDSLPVTESTPAKPTHAYAMQKAEGEGLVRSLGESGTKAAVLRMSNLYGSYNLRGRRIAKGNVLNLFAGQAAGGGPLKVYSPGTQMRDYIFIGDVVAHWEAAARYLLRLENSSSVPVFNVASGEATSVLDLAEMVSRAWSELRPGAPPVPVEVMDNPRAKVEILQPNFSVDTAWTRQTLDIRPLGRLKEWIPRMLGYQTLPP